jgi:hypothetical protein
MSKKTARTKAAFLSIGITVTVCLLMMAGSLTTRAHPGNVPHFQAGAWVSDSDIVSGLGDVGNLSAPTVFQMDSTWYLISGEFDGIFNGYYWSGSAWVSDSSIVSGLGDVGVSSAPAVFQMDSTWYLIGGEADGVFNGYYWSGSAWVSDSSIVSGLGDVGDYSALTVFQMDSTWYLISGKYTGVFDGYHWESPPTPTNTPTPYLEAYAQNPQGTPVPSHLIYYPWNVAQYTMCTDCISYTTTLTDPLDPYYQFAYANISGTLHICLGATPDPGGGYPLSSSSACGYGWDDWDEGGHSVNIVLGTATPTPTPTPTPYVHVEARNPQGTPVTVWELGKVEHDETSKCNNCESFDDFIISSSGRILADSGQELGDKQSYDVALGDLDDDGDLDAFVANSGPTPANTVWLNDGAGVFTDSGQELGNSYSQVVALGDLDDDDDLDAIVANYSSNPTIWLNDGTGVFTDSGSIAWEAESIALADVDDDNDPDIFIVSSSYISPANQVWLNDGTGVFTDSGQRLGDLNGVDVAFGDVDDDDDLDVFVVNYTSPQKEGPDKVWLNDGTGVFTDSGQSIETNGNGLNVALADVDDDDDLDAFIAGELESTVWLNDGTGVFTDSGQIITGTFWSYERVALSDLDLDGDPDAFLSKTGEYGKCAVFTNDGTGAFENPSQRTLDNCYSFGAALGDLNDDGYPDSFSISATETGIPSETHNQVFLNTFAGVYVLAYSNQMVIGVTPEPETGWKPDDTAYYWDEMPGGGEYSASFIVATPTPTPVPKALDVTVRDDSANPVNVNAIIVTKLTTGAMVASCMYCNEILNLDISSYDSLNVQVFPYSHQTPLGPVADPDTGYGNATTYIWPSMSAGAYSVQFIMLMPTPTPTPTSTPIPTPKFGTDLFQMPLFAMQPIEFPAPPIMPSFPDLEWPVLPTPDLKDLPTLEPLVVPTIDFPPIPDFEPPQFPATITLHAEALQLPTVTLPNSQTIAALYAITEVKPLTEEWGLADIMAYAVFSLPTNTLFGVTPTTAPLPITINPPTFPITFGLPTAISTVNISKTTKEINDKFAAVITKSIALKDAVIATTGDLNSIKNKELAGKTPQEMADEMTSGYDLALSYLRGVSSIAVIGPILATILIGLGWITFVTTFKMVAKVTMAVISAVLTAIKYLVPFFG